MSKDHPTNLAASIRQRLLNLARTRNEDFQYVLTRYAMERLLYRLGQSQHADQFLLKGAMLFQLWTGEPHRSTLDLDLLATGDYAVARFESIFREVCAQVVVDDGLQFIPAETRGEVIREDQRYAGVRIRSLAMLGTARVSLQIDIGFGDTVTPGPVQVRYPSMLNLPTLNLRAYPRETVIAEKYEAMVALGMANSRMKDFYDIWLLCEQFDFDGAILGRAIRATFERRGTPLPNEEPLVLTNAFSGDPVKQVQWRAFVNRGRLRIQPPPLDAVITTLAGFLWPITLILRAHRQSAGMWRKHGPWTVM